MAKKDTKRELIKAGMNIIARQGFNSTGIEAVLKQSQVPKGSFYHHFPSKQAFGLAVVDHFAAGIDRIFASYLTDAALPPLTRLRNCLESLVARFEDNNCSIGCLAANLGQELADQSEEFRQRLVGVFRSWMVHIEKCIREAQETGQIPADIDPESMSEFFLSGFEGALLLSKVLKSPAPLKNFVTVFFARVLK
jgi:TetR/AcrR family transcriptional regulator, transcriptional repressor for nem operon